MSLYLNSPFVVVVVGACVRMAWRSDAQLQNKKSIYQFIGANSSDNRIPNPHSLFFFPNVSASATILLPQSQGIKFETVRGADGGDTTRPVAFDHRTRQKYALCQPNQWANHSQSIWRLSIASSFALPPFTPSSPSCIIIHYIVLLMIRDARATAYAW